MGCKGSRHRCLPGCLPHIPGSCADPAPLTSTAPRRDKETSGCGCPSTPSRVPAPQETPGRSTDRAFLKSHLHSQRPALCRSSGTASRTLSGACGSQGVRVGAEAADSRNRRWDLVAGVIGVMSFQNCACASAE